MTVLVTLVAHDATLATRQAAFPADEPLLEDRRLPTVTAPWRGRAVLCSPGLACRQMAARFGLDAVVDHALRDLDSGRWSGRALADVAQIDPDAVMRWRADPAFCGHGGESREQLARRMAGWLDRIAQGDRHVVAFTHVAVIRMLVLAVVGAPPAAFWSVDVVPATTTELRHDGRRWALRGLGNALSDGANASGS